jgi:hypothetical protein
MVKTRLFRAPVRRLLFASLAVVIALFVAAMPAYAAKGGNGGGKNAAAAAPQVITVDLAHSSFMPNNPCSYDATVSWGGLKGTSSAVVRLVDSAGNVLGFSPQINSASGGGWYIFTFTFTGGAGGAARDISATGTALQSGVVAGTAVSNSMTTTCTGPVSVSWPSTFLQLS